MKSHFSVDLLRDTFSEWKEDKAVRLGAALAYYAIFAIPPLIVIVIGIIGLFYKGDAAGAVQAQLATLIGKDTAQTVMQTQPHKLAAGAGSVVPKILSFAVLLFGAAGVFGSLQDALDTIWEVQPKPGQGFLRRMRDRFISLAMIFGVVFLLLVSLLFSTAVS